jgi:Rap1a immunity proteins
MITLAAFLMGGTMRKAIICGALMALTITTARAQQSLFSASSVLPGCKAVFEEGRGLGRQDTGYCVGAVNALAFLAPTECVEIPDGVTFLQVLLVVVHFIEARPQRMDDAFVGLAFEALLDAWPCRK